MNKVHIFRSQDMGFATGRRAD